MSTLLLRFAAPMQSWGSESRFERRDTQREPTKSGVIGLLSAALGRQRSDSIEDLTTLKFGVRVDAPGQLLRDFQTGYDVNPELYSAKKADPKTHVSNCYYLADAVFLVGLEGDAEILQKLSDAVMFPYYPLYLGRRSCPPVGRLTLGVKNTSLEEALTTEAWLVSPWRQKKILSEYEFEQRKKCDYANQNKEVKNIGIKPLGLTVVLDSDTGFYKRRDIPITFKTGDRKYDYRNLVEKVGAVDVSKIMHTGTVPTQHDPFENL